MTTNGSQRRVVVTGMGMVCSLGTDVEEVWSAILAGRSGAGPIRQFDSSKFPVRIGSEVDVGALPPPDFPGLDKFFSRAARFGLFAMDRAWADAGLQSAEIDRWRCGVTIGASTFPVVEGNLPDPRNLLDGNRYNADAYLAICRERPDLLAQRDIPSISTLLSLSRDLRGASCTVQSACTSATQAIGEAFESIREGRADLVVTGGTDSMMGVICVTGFTLLGALTQQNHRPDKASRPFDLKRDGFLIGEGAGVIVLEEMQHALNRGARVHAELTGYGSSSDGYRFTDLHPEGEGPARCMTAAFHSAGIAPKDVSYVNAHGTSTPQNDSVETKAIKKAFGDCAYDVPVSSTKSQLGHLVCAAGGVEAIFCIKAIESQTIPPTINLDNHDPDCDLDYVPHVPRAARVKHAVSNSFGFGGQNGTLVFSEQDGAAR
jgi:3-oxoacyl-[acyl-carrier-protein] synthase II